MEKSNGKYCSKCGKSPAYDYDDIVKGRFCAKDYFIMLLGAIAAIGIIIMIVS